VARYLNWINYATRVFNIGNYRRKLLGADHHADFFNPENEDGNKKRMEMAEAAMEVWFIPSLMLLNLIVWNIVQDMLAYLNSEGEVAIYDGTNSTLERRLWIQVIASMWFLLNNDYTLLLQSQVAKQNGFHLLFIESICEDDTIIERNIVYSILVCLAQNNSNYFSYLEIRNFALQITKLRQRRKP